MDHTFRSLSFSVFECQGIARCGQKENKFLFCKRSDVDFIFLQETHSGDVDEKFWKTQWGNTVFYSHGSNHSAGVATLTFTFTFNHLADASIQSDVQLRRTIEAIRPSREQQYTSVMTSLS